MKNNFIRIYGRVLKDLNNLSREKLIEVYAIGNGIQTDTCRRVYPHNIIVVGQGKPAECNGSRLPSYIKVWVIKKSTIIKDERESVLELNQVLKSIKFMT